MDTTPPETDEQRETREKQEKADKEAKDERLRAALRTRNPKITTGKKTQSTGAGGQKNEAAPGVAPGNSNPKKGKGNGDVDKSARNGVKSGPKGAKGKDNKGKDNKGKDKGKGKTRDPTKGNGASNKGKGKEQSSPKGPQQARASSQQTAYKPWKQYSQGWSYGWQGATRPSGGFGGKSGRGGGKY